MKTKHILWVLLVLVTILCVLFVWTGDIRFRSTAGILILPSVILGFVALINYTEGEQ